MVYHLAALLWLLPVVGSAGPTQLLKTSLRCGGSLPFNELAAIASSIDGVHFTPANPDCAGLETADFNVVGVSETELVAMLLRWEIDVSYAGYQLNAVTAVAVNSEKVGPAPTKAFLTARQVSAPMGVALAAFSASGITALVVAGPGARKRPGGPPSPSSCYIVLTNDGFY